MGGCAGAPNFGRTVDTLILKHLYFVLKISRIGAPDHTVSLKLEGRVAGPWAEELRRVADTTLATDSILTLDLRDVSFVDQNGAALLTSLGKRGAQLLHLSPFVAEQLKASANDLLK